ncbi:fatty acid/sphingolipid desaturase [Thozetella sp. PMI_491]|nr:fatty acid/sphingolipid desaturase [Thozetella sp. PMI_491]
MGPNSHDNMGRYPILSRRKIEALIAEGNLIVIMSKSVLRVNSWIKYHPGGEKTIEHMVGRDATDEIVAMHSKETCTNMTRYQIGCIAGSWRNFTPPIQGGYFRSLVAGEPEDSNDKPRHVGLKTGSNKNHTESIDIRERRELEVPKSPLAAQEAILDGPRFLDTQTKEELELTLEKYPAVNDDTQRQITEKYRELHRQIEAEGLYVCNYLAYAWEAGRCSFLLGLSILLLNLKCYWTSAIFMGVFWSQLVFAAHDAGHMGITHNYTVDTLIAMIIAAPIGGLSMGWWKRSHNVHHIVTNAPEHDPDNQHLPFLAVNHRFLGGLFSTYHNRPMLYDSVAEFLVPYQPYLYYFIMMVARFNLYAQSWIFLAQGQGPRKGAAWWHRWFEIVGVVIFVYWYGYLLVYKSIPNGWDRTAFVLISHFVNMPLHVQFTVSHFAMSTADLGPIESFAQKMLRTTMDVDCPEWMDWFHGGLQFQAIHHLYPRIPRHNLRRTQKLVQDFCNEVNIPYALYGFAAGNVKVVSSLAEVSRQAAILAQCQRATAERGALFHSGH